jgi:hypothetical protein
VTYLGFGFNRFKMRVNQKNKVLSPAFFLTKKQQKVKAEHLAAKTIQKSICRTMQAFAVFVLWFWCTCLGSLVHRYRNPTPHVFLFVFAQLNVRPVNRHRNL